MAAKGWIKIYMPDIICL